MRRVGLLVLSIAGVTLTLTASSTAATTTGEQGHTSTGPYVLGAVVIAIVAVALLLQLIIGMRRARRRR